MYRSSRLSIGAIIAGVALVLSMGVSAAFAEDGHGGRDRDRDRGGDHDDALVVVNQNPAPRVDNEVNDNDVNDVDVNDDND
jgi:hypothetical protein